MKPYPCTTEDEVRFAMRELAKHIKRGAKLFPYHHTGSFFFPPNNTITWACALGAGIYSAHKAEGLPDKEIYCLADGEKTVFHNLLTNVVLQKNIFRPRKEEFSFFVDAYYGNDVLNLTKRQVAEKIRHASYRKNLVRHFFNQS